MTDPFRLTEAERHHPLWARLKAHLISERDTARAKVGGDVEMTERQTAVYRGRIKCLDGLITLGDDRPVTGD